MNSNVPTFRSLSCTFLLFCTCRFAEAGTVMVAAAANFTATAKELATSFENNTDHRAVISFGSTGKLYAQITNGAPYEVFLAADNKSPKMLIDEGKAVSGSGFTYAKGKIALFSMDRSFVNDVGLTKDTINKVRKLALANPKTAPYGQASIETLKALGVHDQLQNKIVLGDNIVQTYQFIYTANATAGFVALSQLVSSDIGSTWVVPANLYTPIHQDAVLLTRGFNSDAAKDFLQFIQSEEAKKIIRRYGYSTS